MRIMVQKFGETSLASPEGRVMAVEKIAAAKKEGFSPVVVVSAMGRKGEPYAAETLIDLVEATGGKLSARDLDLLLASGEIISAVIMVQSLEAAGFPAVALTGPQAGIIADDGYGEVRTADVAADKILRHLGDGKVVVVAGFPGTVGSGEAAAPGGGGADAAAVILGCALEAEMVEFYTEGDGVMTSDPEIVPDAKILRRLSYREICEMANQGTRAVHPKAMAIARDKAVPVRIKNAFSKDEGTLISDGMTSRIVTGLAHQAGLAQVLIRGREGQLSSLDGVRVFKTLAGAGINVDMNSVSPDRITFVIKREMLERALNLLEPFAYQIDCVAPCAKISVIGAGMQNVPGVMARVVESMQQAGITILLTVDSEITISCLVPEEEMDTAIRRLHAEFALGD